MWQCKNCKEQNEDSFDICWKCGYGVDGETPKSIQENVDTTNQNIDKNIKENIQNHQEQKSIKKKRLIRVFIKSISLIFSLWLMFYIIIPIYKSYSNKAQRPSSDIDATMINIYGKTDKRLKLKFVSTYRPVSTASNPECKSYHDINTATKRVPLRAESRTIENQDEYNITIPIYNKDMRNKCEYEFVGISVRVERMYERGGLYANIPVLTDTPIYTSQGDSGGEVGGGTNLIKIKKYFRMPDDVNVRCLTIEYSKYTNEDFICRLSQNNINSSIDKIKDESIKLDIIVDENLCRYLFKEKHISIYYYRKGNMSVEEMKLFDSKQKQFRMPKTPLHIKIKNLITGEDNE